MHTTTYIGSMAAYIHAYTSTCCCSLAIDGNRRTNELRKDAPAVLVMLRCFASAECPHPLQRHCKIASTSHTDSAV